jgi:AraC family ethanolamine operon transcriptional activator
MDEKIGLPELCREVGVGARALQYCFNEIYGTTPVQFTKLIKIRRARSLLFESDPTTTCVKTIAYETGFTELGRFAGEYRKQYDETPSATLKRSA